MVKERRLAACQVVADTLVRNRNSTFNNYVRWRCASSSYIRTNSRPLRWKRAGCMTFDNYERIAQEKSTYVNHKVTLFANPSDITTHKLSRKKCFWRFVEKESRRRREKLIHLGNQESELTVRGKYTQPQRKNPSKGPTRRDLRTPKKKESLGLSTKINPLQTTQICIQVRAWRGSRQRVIN
jgi:hypothetical protein